MDTADPAQALLARTRADIAAAGSPERLGALLDLLGDPQTSVPTVRVVGTGPDGRRTALALATFVQSVDLRPGVLLAAHLHDIAERIQLDGSPISQTDLEERAAELAGYVSVIDGAHSEALTGSELVAGLGIAHLTDAPVDLLVVHDAGGTLPAVGSVRSDVVVVCGIDADDTRALRSAEAAIAAADAEAVVVCAPQPDRIAAALGGAAGDRQVVRVGTDVRMAASERGVGGHLITVDLRTTTVDEVFVPVHGAHQVTTAVVAMAALEAAVGTDLDAATLRQGAAALHLPGSVEVRRTPDVAPVVVDVVASEAGARALATTLHAEFAFRATVVVAAVDPRADAEAIAGVLASFASHLVVVPVPGAGPTSADALADAARAGGAASVEVAADVPSALEAARALATPLDGVVVVGPDAVVGAARELVHDTPAPH